MTRDSHGTGKERDTLHAAIARERAALGFGFVVEHLVLAMQAAWLEWKHGEGAEHAMIWIENTLDGPDQIPDVAETGTVAQAFFDREIKDSRRRQTEALTKLDEREAGHASD